VRLERAEKGGAPITFWAPSAAAIVIDNLRLGANEASTLSVRHDWQHKRRFLTGYVSIRKRVRYTRKYHSSGPVRPFRVSTSRL
jgi:hypothetical protein